MFHQNPAVVTGVRDSHISQALGSWRGPRCSHSRVPTMRRNATPPRGGSIWTGKSSRQRCACVRARGLFPPMKAATDSKAAMLFFLPSSSSFRDFFGVRIVNGRSAASIRSFLLVMDHCPWAASSASVRRSFSSSGNSFLPRFR